METLKAIANRSSVRSYKEDQISRKELEQILEAGKAAPVGMALYDDLLIKVIQNKDYLKRLNKGASVVFNREDASIFYGAPTAIMVCSKLSQFNLEQNNAACVLENMILAATDLGLGTVFIRSAVSLLSKDQSLLEALNLAEGFVPIAAMAVGYPDENTPIKPKKHEIKVEWML